MPINYDYEDRVRPNIEPIRRCYGEYQHTDDTVEEQLNEMFISIFDTTLAKDLYDTNVLGVPFLAGEKLLKRSVDPTGLSILKGGNNRTIRYLYKAWVGRGNGHDGLDFLRTYINLLLPDDAVTIDQQMQEIGQVYPEALSNRSITGDDVDKFLTARVNIDLSQLEDPQFEHDLQRIISSILPARIVPVFFVWAELNFYTGGATETLAPEKEFRIYEEHERQVVCDSMILNGSWTINDLTPSQLTEGETVLVKPLILDEYLPWRLYYEDENNPYYGYSSFAPKQLDGSWVISEENPSIIGEVSFSDSSTKNIDGSWQILEVGGCQLIETIGNDQVTPFLQVIGEKPILINYGRLQIQEESPWQLGCFQHPDFEIKITVQD